MKIKAINSLIRQQIFRKILHKSKLAMRQSIEQIYLPQIVLYKISLSNRINQLTKIILSWQISH